MGALLIFLLSLYQLQASIRSEIVDTPRYNSNEALENSQINDLNPFIRSDADNSNIINTSAEFPESGNVMPIIKNGQDRTEMQFRQPIASVNIDYAKNVIVLKFRRDRPTLRTQMDSAEDEKLKWENNFMRFGKRQLEHLPPMNTIDSVFYDKIRGGGGGRYERSHEAIRDSRGDNFMRFGRSPNDFMRFGRTPNDFMRFGRATSDFMRFGRNPSDFMRFGRDPADFMRFGRSSSDFMRFGRNFKQERRNLKGGVQKITDKNFMRFGRPDNFMRFGRNPPEKTDKSNNFMRFGRMQTEKNTEQVRSNRTKSSQEKSKLKEAVTLIHQTEKDTDGSNPMDKAIQVLFEKQQEEQQPEELIRSSQEQGILNSDESDLEQEYLANIIN